MHYSKEEKKEVEQILEMVLSDLYKSTEFNLFSPKDPGLERGKNPLLCVGIGQVFVT